MKHTLLVLTLLSGFSFCSQVFASAIANSNIELSDLYITPDSGTLEIIFDWDLEAFAEAKNSLGEIDQDLVSSFLGGSVNADASVTWADGSGSAIAAGFPPDLNVSGNASSNVDITGCGSEEANATGRSSLFSGFYIEDTDNIGASNVNVNFSAIIDGLLKVWTDGCGRLAQTEVIFTLEIFDFLPPVNGTPQDSIVWSYSDFLSVGKNSHEEVDVRESLSADRVLEFDKDYFFIIEIDSESKAIVPAPATLTLLLFVFITLLRSNKRA